MLKEENTELLINEKCVESDYTFTADSKKMKEEVTYIFDATSLDGKQLVTFEELYDLSNPDKLKMVMEQNWWFGEKNKIIYVIEAGSLRIDCFFRTQKGVIYK